VSRAVYSGREDIGTGPLGVVGNLVWLVLAKPGNEVVEKEALERALRAATARPNALAL
jgi:hypothetical protein